MALKILAANEQITITRIIMALYGPPGVGKSSLSFTSDKPILFDFDTGAHRAANRKDTVQVSAWADVASVTVDDLSAYNTVIIDTVGRALDMLAVDIMRREPKLGRAGALSQQGWGRLKAEFLGWLRTIRDSGKDIILIAHGSEKISGEETIERLDISGGTKDEVYKVADAMGRIAIREGKRMLDFDPTESAFGKNPAQLPRTAIPAPAIDGQFLTKIIQQTKDSLNTMSEETRKEQERVEKLLADFRALETIDDFNRTAQALGPKGTNAKDKAILTSVATSKGFIFGKSGFELKAQA